MNLYLEVDENGLPINHPHTEENLLQVYPDGIPSRFKPFNRVQKPEAGVFEIVSDDHHYVDNNGVWEDAWTVTRKTEAEILQIKKEIDLEVTKVKFYFTQHVNGLIEDPNASEAQKIGYSNYLTILQAYTVTDYDNVEVPKIPVLDINGNPT